MPFWSENAQIRRMTTKSGGHKEKRSPKVPIVVPTVSTHEQELAALVMEFCSNGQFDAWYEAHNDKLEGFIGVSNYLVMCSATFDRAVHTYLKQCSEDEANNFDWLLMLEEFVAQLLLNPPMADGVVEDYADGVLNGNLNTRA